LIAFMAAAAQARAEGHDDDASAGLPVPQLLVTARQVSRVRRSVQRTVARLAFSSVLLWRSHEKLRSERNIADLEIAPTQHGYPVNYLLDGSAALSDFKHASKPRADY
jgi:hypothetical protein